MFECADYCSTHLSIYYWPCHSLAACCTRTDVIWKWLFLLFLVRTLLLKRLAVQIRSNSLAAVHMKYAGLIVIYSRYVKAFITILAIDVTSWSPPCQKKPIMEHFYKLWFNHSSEGLNCGQLYGNVLLILRLAKTRPPITLARILEYCGKRW